MRTLAALNALVVLVFAGSAMAAPKPTITTRSSTYGTILFDSRGFVLYAFTKDPARRSTCTGACAKAWPPYLVKGGVSGKLVGTTRRTDGTRQVTYGGRPLYYYVGDRTAGQILCQNVAEFGGLWLVVRPNAKLVRSS